MNFPPGNYKDVCVWVSLGGKKGMQLLENGTGTSGEGKYKGLFACGKFAPKNFPQLGQSYIIEGVCLDGKAKGCFCYSSMARCTHSAETSEFT